MTPRKPTRGGVVVASSILALSSRTTAPLLFKSSPFSFFFGGTGGGAGCRLFRFFFERKTISETQHLDCVAVLGKDRYLCSTFSTKGTERTRDESAVISTRGPTWSVNELVRGRREDDEESDGSARRGKISDEEFRKTVESVKLSFENNPKGEQLAKREVEEILRFSEMVLGEKKSDTEGEAEGAGLYKSNGPTHRRQADE